MNLNDYKATLVSSGKNLSEVRRKQANDVVNYTFTNDPAYKRCRVLTSDGWTWQDAKYQRHTTPSILKDEVDYYLQFRPGVHFKLGTYVIVPDDTSPEVNTPENPFNQPIIERTQWWMIVGRTDANQFIRYSVLKCNWNFQWVYKGKIQSIYGCIRQANSYTSGIYMKGSMTTLDNIINAWLPDIPYTYDNYESIGLTDVRTLDYDVRFMISDNKINPKIYSVSKIQEVTPIGIVKLTLKQSEFDPVADNVELGVCDYYQKHIPEPEKPSETGAEKEELKISCKIKGISSVKIGQKRTYTLLFTDNDGDEIHPEFTWNIVSDCSFNKSENGNKLYITCTDKAAIGSVAELQIIVNEEIISTLKISIEGDW